MQAFEANFDGLVGPTHNYAGLSFGNVASRNNEKSAANPKAAAKQGLRKMKQLGRPRLSSGRVAAAGTAVDASLLRDLGFTGDDADGDRTRRARSARVAGRREFRFGNVDRERRDGEPIGGYATTAACISRRPISARSCIARSSMKKRAVRSRAIFTDETRFKIHHALPGTPAFGDEGAANHTRFCNEYGEKGVEFFVYGRSEYRSGHD